MRSAALAAVLGAFAAASVPVKAPAALPVIVVHAPKTELRLEVARSPRDQQHGLMGRTTLGLHAGMLFVFPADDAVTFWMKDTLISLDMVFVAADGTVRTVDAAVPTAPPNASDDAIAREPGVAKYVIELAAGEAARAGIAPGVRLEIPPLPRA